MIELYCNNCNNRLLARISIKNITSYTFADISKGTFKPVISELQAADPKIDILGFLCPNCGKNKSEEEIRVYTALSGLIIPLKKAELIEVKGSRVRMILDEENRLTDAQILEHYARREEKITKITRINNIKVLWTA